MRGQIPHPVKHINYVIVVHGIGDQRPNETVLPVINRFAEVRQHADRPTRREVVTLGMITSQTGKPQHIDGEVLFHDCKPWAEFRNIPQEPHGNLPPFLGDPSFLGENIRFVDMYWADIMEEEFGEVGQKVGVWAKSLVGRLEAKAKSAIDGTFRGSKEEAWILPILYQLEETLIFLDNLLSSKFPFVEELVFNKFLGDVQLYGEYQQIRGRAVRRFHELFEKIEREHIRQFCPDSTPHDRYFNADEQLDIKPRYTIVAHSLGTVMAMDALLFGHTNKLVYQEPTRYSNVPFPGYASAHELVGMGQHQEERSQFASNYREFMGESWIGNVANFVTLGSPIDKFLTIWWQHYLYVGGDKDSIAKSFDTVDELFYRRKPEERIRHYNYCDEQDPVGHRLDKFTGKKVYDRIFSLEEDVVFNRYGQPGVAHVKYWDDIELFKRIVRLAVDGEPKEALAPDFPDFRYKPGTYRWVMFYSYGLFQMIAVLLTTFWGLWGWESESWKISVLGSLGLVGTVYLLRKLIKLNVWWRQALKFKNTTYGSRSTHLGNRAWAMRFLMHTLLALLTALAVLYIPSHIAFARLGMNDVYRYLLYFGDLAVVSALGLLLHYLLYTRQRGAPGVSFHKTAEFYTIAYLAALFGSVAGLVYAGINPLLGVIPYEGLYNTPFTVFLISCTVVWGYTMSCHFLARRTVRLAEGKK
jgi:hypothetical protein